MDKMKKIILLTLALTLPFSAKAGPITSPITNTAGATSFSNSGGGAGGAGGAGGVGTGIGVGTVDLTIGAQSAVLNPTLTSNPTQTQTSNPTLTSSVNPNQQITQNFEGSKAIPNMSGTYAPSRDVQLYGQQGGTANVAGSKTQIKAIFKAKYRDVVTIDGVKLIVVTSKEINNYKHSDEETADNVITTWIYPPYPIDVLGTITLSPDKHGNVVDGSTLKYVLQTYLDEHYTGLRAVTIDELISTTYGNTSAGNGFALNPTVAASLAAQIVTNGTMAYSSNKGNVQPEGWVGYSVFLVSKKALENFPLIKQCRD